MNDYNERVLTTYQIRLWLRDDQQADFLDWLAEVERAAAEKAWDEGSWAQFRLTNGPDPAPTAVNPYRKEQ